ncbi:MAG: biotin transporter BioY [Anaerolineales bacterium]|nr:biotin transporter BioY [Anaerolineales bacterium]
MHRIPHTFVIALVLLAGILVGAAAVRAAPAAETSGATPRVVQPQLASGEFQLPIAQLLANATAVSAGDGHTCALTPAGGVKCWGLNDAGQLGDGTQIDRWTPVDVTGLITGVQSIAAGGNHTCALTTEGIVRCWGMNNAGQLGDGTNISRPTAADVAGLTGAKAVAAGWRHTCAVTAEDGVKCWGWNDAGQLGDGTNADRWTPVDVTGLASGIQAVAAGLHHTCALTITGGLKCWGANAAGQLGDSTTTDSSTPVDVTGLASGIQSVVAGAQHTCALTSDGGARCWGDNYFGQLGDGTTESRSAPVDVTGLANGIQAMAAGGPTTCALTTDGGVKCWGHNNFGQLGDNTTDDRWTPVDVTGLAGGIQAIAAGGPTTCALTTDGVSNAGAELSGPIREQHN